MKHSLLILLCFSLVILQAQPRSTISKDLNALLDSAEVLQNRSSNKEAMELLEQARPLLDSTSPPRLLYSYYKNLGVNQFEGRDIPSARKNLTIALKIARELDDSSRIGEVHNSMANIHIITADYKQALKSYQTALDYLEGQDSAMHKMTLMNMANAYEGLDQYDKALNLFTEARQHFSRVRDYQNLGIAENNIGEIYRTHIHDYDKAQTHYRRAIAANMRVENKLGLSQNYHNLSALYLDRKLPDSALTYAYMSRQLKEQLGDTGGLASANYNLGSIYQQKGNYEKAVEYYHLSLEQSEQYQITEGIYYNSLSLGQVYLEMGRYRQAEVFLMQALEIATQAGSLNLLNTVNTGLYELHKKQGHIDQALYYYETAQQFNDSISAMKSEQNLEEIRTRYEADIAEAENLALREKQKAQDHKLQSQQYLIYSSIGFIVLLLLGGFGLIRTLGQRNRAYANEKRSKTELALQYEKVKESQEKLAQTNDLKNKILSVLGHDLRSPLYSIQMLLATITNHDLSDEELDELLGNLTSETELCLSNLQEILAWARLEMDEQGKMLQPIPASKLFEEVTHIYDSRLKAKQIRVITKVPPQTQIWADKNQMRSIVGNLLSNAIKFSPEQGSITLSCTESKDHSIIRLSDCGKGIDPAVLKNLNSRAEVISKKGTTGERGTGIGLRIVHDFVMTHNGTLHFENNADGGTTVTVSIPKTS